MRPALDPSAVLSLSSHAPFQQVWTKGCTEILAQVLTPDSRVAADLLFRGDSAGKVELEAWMARVSRERNPGMLQVRLRIQPAAECAGEEPVRDILMGPVQGDGARASAWRELDHGLDGRLWIGIGEDRIGAAAVMVEQAPGLDPGRTVWAAFALGSAEDRLLRDRAAIRMNLDLSTFGGGWAEFSWPASVYRERS